MQKSKVLALALGAGLVIFTTGCEKLQSRDQMNKGVKAYKSLKYADAVKHFQEAVQLDPTNDNAQLYLATSYMTQWVPGVDSSDNKKNYQMAQQEFEKILKKEPSNSTALASLAFMAYSSAATGTPEQKAAAFDEARKWNQRRIEADPKEAEAYYYLGVIDWDLTHPPVQTVRVEEKMAPNDPGPIKDPKARQQLQEKYLNMVNDGLDNVKKSLDLNKENEDAMSYMNLLLRVKANLENSPDAAKADIAQAEDWFNKSTDMKRIKASRPAKKEAA
jgi:tetratricopeptide (TPR) repeat protein